jgi:hypothetical protein
MKIDNLEIRLNDLIPISGFAKVIENSTTECKSEKEYYTRAALGVYHALLLYVPLMAAPYILDNLCR